MLVDMDDFIDFVKNKLGESIWVPLYKNLNKEDKLQLYNSVNQYQYSDEIINITEKSLSISDVIVMSRVPSKQTMKP